MPQEMSSAADSARGLPFSLPRLLVLRAALAREAYAALSHGATSSMELVHQLLQVEACIESTDPGLYARRQSAWAREEANLLHTPGSDVDSPSCHRCRTRLVSAPGPR
jgi:hypothetical protein